MERDTTRPLHSGVLRILPSITSRIPVLAHYQRLFPAFHLIFRFLSRPWHELRWFLNSRETVDRWIEKQLNLGNDYWLFVLGLNNSGTTLLTRVLETHPRIRSLPHEGQWLTSALPHPPAYGVVRTWATRLNVFHWNESHDPKPARRIQYDWARYYPPGPGILLEKSPTNTIRARWLARHFKPCRFLAIVRHPYAVCEGARRRAHVHIKNAALHWTAATRCLLEDLRYLQSHLLIRYEDFCQSPELYLSRIEAFLTLPESSLDRTALINLRVRYVGAQPEPLRNMNSESFARLSKEEKEQIDSICSEFMEYFGYEQHIGRSSR